MRKRERPEGKGKSIRKNTGGEEIIAKGDFIRSEGKTHK